MWVELLLVQLALFTAKASVIFEDCGSAYELEAVHIDGCNNRLPCYVTLGDEVPVNIEFVADFASVMLDQHVVININLVNLRTDVHPPLCDILDSPLAANAKTSITSQMSVPTDMALNQRGYLKWQVYNESGKQVLCYSVLVQTQSPLQKLLRRYFPYYL